MQGLLLAGGERVEDQPWSWGDSSCGEGRGSLGVGRDTGWHRVGQRCQGSVAAWGQVPRASSALVLRALLVGLPLKQLPEPCVFAQASGGRSLSCLSPLSTWDQRYCVTQPSTGRPWRGGQPGAPSGEGWRGPRRPPLETP